MILRYANDLHEKLIAKLKSHAHVITNTGYLTGEYRSFTVRFGKADGKDGRWSFTDHKSSMIFGFATEAEAQLDDSVKEGDFITLEMARCNQVNSAGRTYVSPKNMLVCPGVSKDDLYNMMVSYVMNLFATTKGIEDQLKLVVCFIWSENGGTLFIDNYREGVDNLAYEIHPYIRAGWDAQLVDQVPDGCLYEDVSTRKWMHHFHNYVSSLGISYDLSFSECDNRWYARMSSAAPDECFISKDRAWVASAAEDCLRHIGRINVADVLSTFEYTIETPYKEAV